ncbi:PHD finger protein ALFIN-LIKE 4-like protein, partial [Drosera capensis]
MNGEVGGGGVGVGAAAAAEYNPRTVEEVFRDFMGRRAGVIKALVNDVEEFFAQCDPEKENLCLYGLPNEQWEVNLPAEEVPPELPEPALGINFARDGMQTKDWLSLVAVHSDVWLLSVAFYFGSRFGFNRSDRYISCCSFIIIEVCSYPSQPLSKSLCQIKIDFMRDASFFKLALASSYFK